MFLLELKVLDKLEQVTRPRGPQDPFKRRDDISQELVNLTSNKMPPFRLKVCYRFNPTHRDELSFEEELQHAPFDFMSRIWHRPTLNTGDMQII